MSFSAQYPPVLTAEGDLTSAVLAKYNQEFQYLYTNLLSQLFSATTGHAHTGSGSDGAPISALSIANDAITTLKILNEAVTAAKLAPDAVTTVKILDKAITTAKLALDAKCPLAGTADKVSNALTINGTEFDGSAAKTVTIAPAHAWTTTNATITSTASSTTPAVVIENYVSGDNWYRKQSDGWIEQGGYNDNNSSNVTVNFVTPFATKCYGINQTPANTGRIEGNPEVTTVGLLSFVISGGKGYWKAYGY